MTHRSTASFGKRQEYIAVAEGQDQQGKNKSKLTIRLANQTKTGWKPRPKFSAYENAFHLLK